MTPNFLVSVSQIVLAATALERSIDACLASCLQGLPKHHHVIVLSRLTFRQRLDILHELARERLGGEECEGFKAWRKRVAKVWARSVRALARNRLAETEFDDTAVRQIVGRLHAESYAAIQWSRALASFAGCGVVQAG